MENLKTINDLGKRIWYRFIKVFFVFVFIVILGLFNFSVFSNGIKQIDQEKTIIHCSPRILDSTNVFTQAFYNQRKSDYSLKEIGISLNISNFRKQQVEISSLNDDYALTQIFNKCLPPNEASNEKSRIEQYLLTGGPIPYSGVSIKPVFTYVSFLGFFFIGNFIILFIVEIIRRSFYYIVLGKKFYERKSSS